MFAKAFHGSNPQRQEEMHGNLGQLTLKNEEGKEEPNKIEAYHYPLQWSLLGCSFSLTCPTPPALTAQREASLLAFPELAYLGLFDLNVELPAAWQAESSLMLGAGRWSRLQWRGLITVLTSVAPSGPTSTQCEGEGRRAKWSCFLSLLMQYPNFLSSLTLSVLYFIVIYKSRYIRAAENLYL